MTKILFGPLVWNWGALIITPFGICFGLALIIYLFMAWKHFHEDYDEEAVIRFSLATLVAFLFGGRMVYGIFHFSQWVDNWLSWFNFWHQGGFSYWGGGASLILTVIIFSRQRNWNVWYFLEGITRPVLTGAVIIAFGLVLTFGEIKYLVHAIIFLTVLLITKLLSGYRSFTWYPSGKTGFIFLVVSMSVLFLEGGLDFYLSNHIYSRGVVSWIVGGGTGLVLYTLSRKK